MLTDDSTLCVNRNNDVISVVLTVSRYNKRSNVKSAIFTFNLRFELETIMVKMSNDSSFIAEKQGVDNYIFWTQKKHCLALKATETNQKGLEDIFVAWRRENS